MTRSARALATLWGWQLNRLPGVTPGVADDERFFFGFPREQLVGINIGYKPPQVMEAIGERIAPGAATFNEPSDEHAVVAGDENEPGNGTASFVFHTSVGAMAPTPSYSHALHDAIYIILTILSSSQMGRSAMPGVSPFALDV
jgi:hypothetical protein